jgi:multidrug efflux pump subunit AcrA (membrane-fusion protein)
LALRQSTVDRVPTLKRAAAAYLAGGQFNLEDLAAIQQFSGQQQALLDPAFYSANSALKPTIDELRQSSALSS